MDKLAKLQAAQGWAFDLWSALIGAAVTAALAIAMYRFRAALGRAWQSIQEQARQLLNRLTASVEMRYYDGLLNHLAAFEVLPHALALEALYVAPRFVSPLPRPSLAQDGPAMPPRLLLGPVWQATRRLILPGQPGCGQTALLIHLARTFITQNYQGTEEPGHKCIPIYVHLVELSERLAATLPAESESPASEPPEAQAARSKPGAAAEDPALPLIENVTSHASILIAGSIGGQVRRWIGSSQALVLLDGLDELCPSGQAQARAWIVKLVERYPEPRYVVAAPPRQYRPFVEAGFAVLPLAEWGPAEIAELAQRRTKIIHGSADDAARLADAIKPVPGTRPRPLDISLAAWVWQKTGSAPTPPSALYGQLIDSLLDEVSSRNPLSPLLSRGVLGRLATVLLKEGRPAATRAEIEKTIAELLPTETKPTEPPPAGSTGEGAPAAAPPSKLPKGVAEAIEALLQSELLVMRGRDLYAFSHRRLQCYLAAWHLTQFNDTATLIAQLDDPSWAGVFEFCAGLMDMAPLIDIYLKRADDLLRTRLWSVAAWAAAAPPEAAWRGRVLGEAAHVWMQPNALPPIRERALFSLLSTQDKGLPYLFKKAMANPDARLRAQATRGLGLVGREPDLAVLVKMLADPEPGVRAAAIQAIGSIPGDKAIETLVDVLLQADEMLRQAAAEALAQRGVKGKNILRDAVKEDDLLVRRSAAYGLRLVGEPWAIELLTQMEHGDSQWMVRSAATDALRLAREAGEQAQLDLSPVKLDEQGWLIEWGATRGMSVGLGRSAMPVLMKALTEGDERVKRAAVRTLAYLGDSEAIGPLRQALNEPDEIIQAEAWRALTEISASTGTSIPA